MFFNRGSAEVKVPPNQINKQELNDS